MKNPKRHRNPNLPYTPSQEFIGESIKLIREKGVEDTDENLTTMIIHAYRARRAQILAAEAMKLYENH